MLFRFLVCNVRTCSAAALLGFSFLGSLASFCFPSACAWRPSETAGLFTNRLVIGHYFLGGKIDKSPILETTRFVAADGRLAKYIIKMCLNRQMAFGVQILRQQPPTARAATNQLFVVQQFPIVFFLGKSISVVHP